MPVTINGSNTPTAGGVTYGDGTQYATTAAGTSGQLLQSNGASAPSWVAAPSTSPAGSTGQVQYNNAGAFGAVSSGTSGQVLTSAGSGAAPTWSTPSAGAMTLISTQTASTSASVQWTGLSGYSRYLIVMTNLIPTNNNAEIRIAVGTGAGPTYGSFYSWVYSTIYNATLNSNSSGSSNAVTMTSNNKSVVAYSDTTGLSGEVLIVNANGGYTTITGFFIGNPTSATGVDIMTGTFGGSAQDNTARTAVKIYYAAGNVSSGSATLYGLS